MKGDALNQRSCNIVYIKKRIALLNGIVFAYRRELFQELGFLPRAPFRNAASIEICKRILIRTHSKLD